VVVINKRNFVFFLKNFKPESDSPENLDAVLNYMHKIKINWLSHERRSEILSLLVGVDSPKIVEYLEKHPQWIKNTPEKQRADILANCILRGCIDTVKYLINSCKFNVTDKTSSFVSRVPLEVVFSREDDFIKSFFNIVDVNQCDDTGRTPLHYALEQEGNMSALAVLLFHPKLDLEAKTNDGKSILEFLMQQAPWLKDWRDNELQSIKHDIEKYKLPTENLKKCISEIIDCKVIENCDLASALEEIKKLKPSDSLEKKVLSFIKCKYYVDKYFDMETDRTHLWIQSELQNMFCRCMPIDGECQSIHGMVALGLTNEKFQKNSTAFSNYYKELTELAEGRSTCNMEVFDGLITYGFLSKFDLHHLFFLAIRNNQQGFAKKLCRKYGASAIWINIDAKSPPYKAWGVDENADVQSKREYLNKVLNRMRDLRWDSEFIDEVNKDGLIALKSKEPMIRTWGAFYGEIS